MWLDGTQIALLLALLVGRAQIESLTLSGPSRSSRPRVMKSPNVMVRPPPRVVVNISIHHRRLQSPNTTVDIPYTHTQITDHQWKNLVKCNDGSNTNAANKQRIQQSFVYVTREEADLHSYYDTTEETLIAYERITITAATSLLWCKCGSNPNTISTNCSMVRSSRVRYQSY